MKKYYLICHTWKDSSGKVYTDNTVWEGTPAQWLIEQLKPELRHWNMRLISATPITLSEYNKLRGEL